MKERLNIDIIRPIIEKANIKTNEKLYEILRMYKTDEYIYIDAMIRYTKLDKKTIVEILELLNDEKILEKYYSINCHNCGHSIRKFFTKKELTEEIYCDHCDSEVIVETYKAVYKVL